MLLSRLPAPQTVLPCIWGAASAEPMALLFRLVIASGLHPARDLLFDHAGVELDSSWKTLASASTLRLIGSGSLGIESKPETPCRFEFGRSVIFTMTGVLHDSSGSHFRLRIPFSVSKQTIPPGRMQPVLVPDPAKDSRSSSDRSSARVMMWRMVE